MPMVDGEFRRRNGFEMPLDQLQVLSYFLFAFMISSYYSLLMPLAIDWGIRTALIVLYTLLLMGLIVGAFISSYRNPVDKTIYSQLQATPRDVANGELLYCCFCKCKVHKRSKHCRVCNKCIGHFDHHCKWLNTCVGGVNYKFFFFTISDAVCLTGLQMAWNAALLKQFFDEENFPMPEHLQVQGRQGIMVWLIVSLLVACAVFLLLVHLVGFHMFLNYQGISTYDYILKQRAKKAAKKELEDKKKSEGKKEKSGGGHLTLTETRIDAGMVGEESAAVNTVSPPAARPDQPTQQGGAAKAGGESGVSRYQEPSDSMAQALGTAVGLPSGGSGEHSSRGVSPSGVRKAMKPLPPKLVKDEDGSPKLPGAADVSVRFDTAPREGENGKQGGFL